MQTMITNSVVKGSSSRILNRGAKYSNATKSSSRSKARRATMKGWEMAASAVAVKMALVDQPKYEEELTHKEREAQEKIDYESFMKEFRT